MSFLNSAFLVAICVALLMCFYHLQRMLFFTWLKFSTKDRNTAINTILNSLANNKIVFQDAEELSSFVNQLLFNQTYGKEVRMELISVIVDAHTEITERERKTKNRFNKYTSKLTVKEKNHDD